MQPFLHSQLIITHRIPQPLTQTETINTVQILPMSMVEYTFDLPPPTAQSFLWIGFVKKNQISVDFSIFDRNQNMNIYKTKKTGEYLAKLFFYKRERISFRLRNHDKTKPSKVLVSFKCMKCLPDMSTTLAEKTDLEGTMERIRQLYRRKHKMTFMEQYFIEKMVDLILIFILQDLGYIFEHFKKHRSK